uniref:sugar porter family MFS transporter n=1 Tax=uncultured Draconibacterium sp. TaxID=1573823 RepID=UPI00321709FF
MDKKYLYLGLICVVASIGGFLFGFDTAVISGTVGFVETYYSLTKLQLGWFTGSALVGCIVGAVVSGKLSDTYGRRPVLLLAGSLFFISAVGSAMPQNFTLLIIARMVGGIGVGIASVAAPLYISELSPAKFRGRLVALYQLSIVTGIILAYLSNWMILENSNSAVIQNKLVNDLMVANPWKAMFGMETIPALLFVLLMFFVPESPRWLVINKFEEKGKNILARIQPATQVAKTISEIKEGMVKTKSSIRDLLRKGIRKALLIGIALSVFGQLTGVNIVVYYGPTILEDAGLNIGGALQYQVALGIINFVFTVISMFIIDRFGRRPLLVGGMALVAFMLFVTGIMFLFNATALGIVIVLGLYMAFVAISICAVIWVITPEIFPNRIRGRAMSVAIFFNWSSNALAAIVFPWLVAGLGMGKVFILFAIICTLGVIMFYKMVPETKGKSLEEIEGFWNKG